MAPPSKKMRRFDRGSLNWIALALLSIGFCVWTYSSWEPTKRPYSEIWLCELDILYSPIGKTHLEKYTNAEIMLENIKSNTSGLPTPTWHADRRYMSGIIYLTAANKETLDKIAQNLPPQPKFERLLPKQDNEKLKNNALLHTLSGLVILGISIIALFWSSPNKIAMLSTIFIALTLMINEHNRRTLPWQTENEVKAINTLSPKGTSYGHLHANNVIKEHTGEITIRLLGLEGHRTSFRTYAATEIYDDEPKTKDKKDIIWVRSTATDKDILMAAKAAEKISNKDFRDNKTPSPQTAVPNNLDIDVNPHTTTQTWGEENFDPNRKEVDNDQN